jgi:hypothetical protein
VCIVNHDAFAKPGYLIDVPCESLAASGALFTRLLAHHVKVGLSPEQVANLLDLSRQYHEEQVAIRTKFATITEKLELKRGRVDGAAVRERRALLDTHAELFRADEELFFVYARQGHELLTDEQIDRAEAIYHAEKNEGLNALAASLNNAVGPDYAFQLVTSEHLAA